jgi:hypothetical protein
MGKIEARRIQRQRQELARYGTLLEHAVLVSSTARLNALIAQALEQGDTDKALNLLRDQRGILRRSKAGGAQR